MLLIGDGSGANWKIGGGWGCVSIERMKEDEPKVWFGAMNRSTVNFAEMMAYVQPLMWYYAHVENEVRLSGQTVSMTRNVHIITDSKYCQATGTKLKTIVEANGPLWQIFSIFQRHGIFLHWHWRPRNDVALNVYTDALSKAARLTLHAHNPQVAIEQSPDGQSHRKVTEYNPW